MTEGITLHAGPFELPVDWEPGAEPTGLKDAVIRHYGDGGEPALDRVVFRILAPATALSPAPRGAFELPANWRAWRDGDGLMRLQVWSGVTSEYALEAVISADFRQVRLTPLVGHLSASYLPFLIRTVSFWVTAQVVARRGGFMLHCAAARFADGRAILATGPSGAGKSTLSGFFAETPGQCLLTDETAIVLPAEAGFHVYGTPWHGLLMKGCNAGGRLAAAYFLEQGPRHECRPLPLEEATLRLVREVFLPPWDAALTECVLDSVELFLKQVPFRVLRFEKSPTVVGFLEQIP